MNYIELINKFWIANTEKPFTPSDTQLYFYLLHTCNRLAWKVPFGQSDRYLSLALNLSVNTLREAKNRLKQRGLIDFKAPEKGSKGINGQTKYCFTVLNSDTVTDTVTDTNIKPNKTKEEIKKEACENFDFQKIENEILKPIGECKDIILADTQYLEVIAMNNQLGSVEKSKEWVKKFFKTLQNRDDKLKSVQDFKFHFANWLCENLKKETKNETGQKNSYFALP